MNTSSYRRSYGTCFLALFLSFVLALLPTLAFAEDGANNSGASTEESESYSALPAVGYITLLLTGEANGSGATMTGGKISLYRVASINREDPDNHFYDVSGGQFASSEAVAGIRTMSKQQLDAQNPTISETLEKEVTAKGIEPLQTVAIADGEVSFPKVEEGLYLVMQTELSDAQRKVQSFIISVPDEQGELGVVATPKPGAWDGIDPNAPKEKESEKKTQKTEEKKTTPATTKTTATKLSVPATGDRTSRFAFVATAGLAFVLLGCYWHVKRNEHE